ncbi:MAG: alpha/beta hydrolase [Acidimicrobiales bacterium]|jgi:fermentation-respiration switch protein FrsA (DUF1100 family)|nr:alpha/beta hydrolase [Acidimicrobiales bacterium]
MTQAPTGSERIDVAFPTDDGVTLAGWLYRPDPFPGEVGPGVVMNHGFSATRHMGLPGFAEAIAARGVTVLVYDHRNLGDSGGEPRQEIDPWAQMLDARTALTWLGGRPEVDPDRLGLWGSSFSGGEAICLAAVDRRIRAVVANVPFAGSGRVDDGDLAATAERFAAIAAVLDRRSPRPDDPVLGPMPVVRAPGSDVAGFLDQPESAEWFLSNGGPESGWHNSVTVRFSADPPFDPGACIARISPTPLLVLVARDDRVADAEVALRAFDAAREPKQLVMLAGHHFADYQGPGFEQAAVATAEFFARHL